MGKIAPRSDFPTRRRGFSILEVILVLTVMSVLIAFSIPSFQRTVEKAKADIAISNLRAAWAAERFYWLDNRSYCENLSQLVTLDLLDSEMIASTTLYTYSVTVSTDGQGFAVTATRVAGSSWQGSFSIDQTGVITGSVGASGEPTINPPTTY